MSIIFFRIDFIYIYKCKFSFYLQIHHHLIYHFVNGCCPLITSSSSDEHIIFADVKTFNMMVLFGLEDWICGPNTSNNNLFLEATWRVPFARVCNFKADNTELMEVKMMSVKVVQIEELHMRIT